MRTGANPYTLDSDVVPVAAERDSLGPLTLYLVVLVGVPAQLIVAPLGAAGTPAGLLAALGVLWWFAGRLQAPRLRHGPSTRCATRFSSS